MLCGPFFARVAETRPAQSRAENRLHHAIIARMEKLPDLPAHEATARQQRAVTQTPTTGSPEKKLGRKRIALTPPPAKPKRNASGQFAAKPKR
jgi:hypothetical protein